MSYWIGWVLVSLVAAPRAPAAVSADFARKLVDLRAEVEEAGSAYEEELQKRKRQLEPVRARHSELEAQVAKEELRRAQLTGKLRGSRRGALQGAAGRKEEWARLQGWVARLRAYVTGGIPFRREERLERVGALEERVRRRRESSVAVASDLWSATEKELSLTKEIDYRVGKLALPGGSTEGEIARLGMAHILFVSSRGQAGYSRREGDRWTLVPARNGEEKAAIERVVGRLKAKSANGWYEIPGLESLPREEIE